jgi:hypothetical protein
MLPDIIRNTKKLLSVYCVAVDMARFGNINSDEFTYYFFYLQNEMLCTINMLVFSFGNSLL